jgi:hypothetical protein
VRPILFFSHGWNNDFGDAVELYRQFLKELEQVLTLHPLPGPPPLFVGVTWPSIWLPSDEGPRMAAADLDLPSAADHEAFLDELRGVLPTTSNWQRLYELLEGPKLTAEGARELARLIAPIVHPSGEGAAEATASEEKIVAAMSELQQSMGGADDADDDFDAIGTVFGSAATAPDSAGLLDYLDPRWAVRIATLYLMKDRAGTVGSAGVGALLSDMLKRAEGPIFAIGHSFGCKVMLSAVANTAGLPRKLQSMLLLQPAVSHLCFAKSVPGRGGPGGYRSVLDRVAGPILSTYSANDFPLHTIYHRALLRDADLGELRTAGPGDTTAGTPPNDYAALGGYGPRGADQHLIDPIPAPGESLDIPINVRLVALDGSKQKRISGHGDVASGYVAWALRKLLG